MSFDFDVPVDRSGTSSLRWEKYAGRDVIPLWVADTDFRPPPAVRSALASLATQGVLGYTLAPQELRHAIVERLQHLYAWRIDPEWIVFLPGVVSGLHLAARKLVAPGEHVLVPNPVYHHFKRAVELAPRAFSDLQLALHAGRWVFDDRGIERALRKETRLAFLCNPQNPGGTVFTRAELGRFAEVTRDLTIVSDEIHCDLVLDAGKRHVPIASISPEISRRTVTLKSPNKSFNFPSAGCAWAIIENPDLRKAFSSDLIAHVLPSPSIFGYAAALAAYRDGGPWLAAQLEYLRGNRDLVEETIASLPGFSMAHVEATYLAWIDCGAAGMANAYQRFLDHGVALSPGVQFGAPDFVRLNFGTQRAVLQEALSRLRSASTRSPTG